MVKIGLLGLGTVGTGVMKLLERNRDLVTKRLGSEILVKRILVRDLSKARHPGASGKITNSIDDVLGDDELSIIVEVMGGSEPAYSYIKRALALGKHVVTANKQVIAEHGRELTQEARRAGVNLLFEASVAGGIPIIRPLRECLAANEITSVMGILNGTTNYILTQMDEGNLELEKAVKQAQSLGYAEADPADDLNGADATRKIAILASIAFNTNVIPQQVDTIGIERVDLAKIRRAKELGYRLKLVVHAASKNGAVEICVSPALLTAEHPLAQVNDVFNAVVVDGDPVGRLVFIGRGAGEGPTASAVVSDVIEIARGNVAVEWHYGDDDRPVRSPSGVPMVEGLRVWK